MSFVATIATYIAYIGTVALVVFVIRVVTETGANLTLMNDAAESSTNKALDYFTDTDEWREYHSVANGFIVTIPGYPTHTTNKIEIPDTDITGTLDLYMVDNDDVAYFIQAISYGGGLKIVDARASLEGALNGRLNEIEDNKLLSSEFLDWDTHPAVKYVVQSNTTKIYGTMVVVDDLLYDLEMACEQASCQMTDYEKFVSSFTLQ